MMAGSALGYGTRHHVVISLIILTVLLFTNAVAGTMTTVTGGSAISADTTSAAGGSGAWTSLTGPEYEEVAVADLGMGTVILTAPVGFEFNPASTVSIRLISGDANAHKNINSVAVGGTLATATVTATTITWSIGSKSNGQTRNHFTWLGIQVRPTASTPLAAGNIIPSGGSGIGTYATSAGTLTEVAGAAKKLFFLQQPSNAEVCVFISPAIKVAVQDQFGNTVTANSSTVTLAIGSNPGGGTLSGAASVAAVSGTATFSTLSINMAGIGYTLAASSPGLTGVTSNAFTITSGSACMAAPVAEYRFEGCDWTINALVKDEAGLYPGKVVEGARAVPGIDYGNGGLCNVANVKNAGTDYNRHIRLTDNPISLTNDWTLMMWVNFPLNFLNHFIYNNFRYTVLAGGTNDLCWIRKREGGTDITWGASSVPDAHVRDFPDTLTGWHHLAFVGVGSATSLYIDGALWNATDYKQTGLFNRIGSTSYAVSSTARQNIDTQIDEVKFYNSPLPVSQINSIYNNELAKKSWDGTARSCIYCGVVDHYEILHDASALTCASEEVKIIACANIGCTAFLTTPAMVTMSPVGWVDGNTVSFTGSVNSQLRHTAPETIVLGMSDQAPTPLKGYYCVEAIGGPPVSCNMRFFDTGFDFDVPTQTSCKESGNITISAIGRDPDTSLCIPLFVSRTVNVSFWSGFVNPNTGSQAVRVNGNSIIGASPGTPVSLAFDAGGHSAFKVLYNDAGQVKLNARYMGTGSESGLQVLGDDSFVTAPAGLCVYSDAANSDCASGDAACSVFAKAGDPFALKVKGVCWQSDGESNAQFCDNATTANFRMNNIGLTHTLVAPTTGVAGNIAISSANITTAGVVAVQQVVSEVGVFTFKADPPIDYLGAGDVFAGATFASVNIGRFIPDHFAISLLPNPPGFSDECGVGSSAFTYLGQPFNWALIPALTISAMNAVGTVTHNYEGAFWKLTDPLASYTYVDANAPVSLGPLTPETSAQSLPPTINCDGVVTVPLEELTEFNYTRPPAASPVSPFVPDVALSISQASLTDTDSVCYKQGALPGCRGFVVEDITGTHMRHGQIKIFNNFGPETTDIISSPFEAQYYNGIKWLVNVDDTCTTGLSFCPSARVFAVQPVPLIAGKGTLTVSKPDSVIVCPTAPNWLTALADCTVPDSSCGEFTFGIYRGNDRIINWQEIMQ